MSTVTVSTALDRIARLIPVSPAASASRLTGQSVGVCTPLQTLPERFRMAQADRTREYLATGERVPVIGLAQYAPRYVVTSYGVPVAWVTLDGRTHFADGIIGEGVTAETRTMARHRDAIRAAWPERFVMDSMGDPIGEWPLGTAVPAGWQPADICPQCERSDDCACELGIVRPTV